MGRIYIIIGKSATGKDHIYRALKDDKSLGLKPFILYTTRPKRRGEENGEEYYFTDIKELEALREKGKIIEERTYATVQGNWHYFTADNGQIKKDENYITIGTLQSFIKMKKYLGENSVVPLYIHSDPYIRIQRALGREKKQKHPEYKEVCRRFLADEEDFSEEKMKDAGIEKFFSNNGDIIDCIRSVREYIRKGIKK